MPKHAAINIAHRFSAVAYFVLCSNGVRDLPSRERFGKNLAGPRTSEMARRRQARCAKVVGKILTEAEEGGLLLLGQDGRLWTIEKAEIISPGRGRGEPFRALDARGVGETLANRARRELRSRDHEALRHLHQRPPAICEVVRCVVRAALFIVSQSLEAARHETRGTRVSPGRPDLRRRKGIRRFRHQRRRGRRRHGQGLLLDRH